MRSSFLQPHLPVAGLGLGLGLGALLDAAALGLLVPEDLGLGLALARGLARDMGGELTLENPGDGGARFRLELPASAQSPAV